MLFAMAAVATIIAQKDRSGGTGTPGVPPATATQEHDPLSDWESRHPGGGVRSGESDATLRFESIDVHSNDTATLRLAWPLDLIPTNTTIDLLVATSLVNSAWTWQCGHTVGEDDTNWTVTVALPETSPGTAAPSAFYRAVHRETCADTMDDLDGDGIPGAYELAHGTNPYVADAEYVPRLTVGAGGQYATIQAALAASAPYSVVSLASGDYRVFEGIRMPSHPVMVTCEDGYAVFSGATPTGMFMLSDGHESGHTLFRNLYLNLASKSGMQAGFWCGGGLPWVIPGAAAVFENVHIRAPNPGVEYFGWLFYGYCEAPAVIRGCCVNASGAEWMFGVLGDNPPPLALESCTFVNFPTQAAQRTSVAVGLRSLRLGGSSGFTPTVTVSRVLFDASFTNAWPMARFENATGFHVTMADCIRPSEPASSAFAPNVTANVHVATSQVAWAGFPLPGSPAAVLGIGAFRPIPYGSTDDTDRDTLTDYDETYVRNLDPFLADTDGDGADDGDEIRDGTDPSDPDSFLQRLTVTATNTASLAFPVRVAWGHSPTGWEANGLAVFDSGFGEKAYTNAASQATTYMKAFCDMNLDGEYGADDDILIVRTIPHVGTARFDFVFGDVDHDGLSDYDEMHSHGTDPLRADTDGDGMRDGEEISGGTDPTNRHSFVQTQYVSVTNTASLAHAVYLAWGCSATGWESNGLASFPQGFGTNAYETASPQGAVYIKSFCDLNDNGEYDADDDILAVRPIPFGRTAQFNIKFGDVDGDGVPDAQERQDGTDPDDANSFRLRASFRFTDHDAGHGCTNLVAVSLTETEWDLSEVVMRSADETFEYTVNTNVTHGAVYVKCLHDRDGDGLLDVGSEGIRTNRLSYSVRNDTFVEVSIGDYDYDGVCDTQELLDGTDPFDEKNYRLHVRLDIADSDDGCCVTNLVAVSETYDDWQPSSVVTSFVGYAATYATNVDLKTGALQVRCIRDLDRDGEFGTPGDIVYRASAGHSWNGKRFHLAVGDLDGDGVPDSVEKSEGTDPMGATNYCFSLSATVTSIFTPTNRLTAIAYFGNESNVLYGPAVQTGSTLSVDFGHLATASREKVKFLFWDDIDGNGVRDTGERRTLCEFSVVGHGMCATNSLGLGEFDADGDGMLDDWERLHGLSSDAADDATQDTDGDGFINLHEYWAGTDPNDPLEDGSGTALVSGSRSVDDRIAGKQPNVAAPYYVGHGKNARLRIANLSEAIFPINVDCWMFGVDLSCMSTWCDFTPWEWAEPLTLISPLHVMSASHVTPTNGTQVVFRSLGGDRYIRTLVDSKPILGVAADDLCVGILNEPLPSDIKIAKFLPPGYSSYIGNGMRLPFVRIGGDKTCNIEDIVFLSPTSAQSRMIKIEHSLNPLRCQYQRGPIAMDSGHPIFLLIGSELAYLCPTKGFYADYLTTGFLCTYYLQTIQQAMDFLSDTKGLARAYLQTFDFSAFSLLGNAGGLE